MIKSVHDYEISDVFKKDAGFCYVIPKYQRNIHGTSTTGRIYTMIFVKMIMAILSAQ